MANPHLTPTAILVLFAVVAGGAPAHAQSCRPMAGSTVGVVTDATDVLPQRCDEPGKCRIFDLAGRPIGAVGDYVMAGTASPGGLIAVRRKESDLQGYMTPAGAWKIDPHYKRVGPFCEDRAAVQRVDSLFIYIDRDGQQVGAPWDDAEAFTEGRGLVTSYKGGNKFLHGYVGTDGNVAVPVQFEAARLFSEGFAAVRVDGKWGYIDRDGTIAIKPRFAEAEPFRGGRAAVRMSEEWGKNSGLIDRNGNFVVAPRYEQIVRLGDSDLWSASITDPGYRGHGEPAQLSRLVDKDGHVITAGPYNSIGTPSEGLIAVCRDDACGFIDDHGRTVVPMKYKYADDFQEGLAAVSANGRGYGFIDRQGRLVLPMRYDSLGPRNERFGAGPFVQGLAPAGCDGHWGFIDKSGAWAIAPVYRFAEPFDNGFAAVAIRTGTGHVRPDGSAIDFTADEADTVKLAERPCGAPLARP
jgi:hypothetical protein